MNQSQHEVSIEIQDGLSLHFEHDWLQDLTTRSNMNGPWDSWELFQLAYEAEESMQIRHFDDLQCLKTLPDITPLPHQLETARKVLTEMQVVPSLQMKSV